MNERIKELANQLGPVATIGNWGRVEWADNVYPQFGDKMHAAIDLEKFAELIVRECLDSIEYTIGMTCINSDHRAGCNMAIEDLKWHLGVE